MTSMSAIGWTVAAQYRQPILGGALTDPHTWIVEGMMNVTDLPALPWRLCELPLAQIHLDPAFDCDDEVQAPPHLIEICRWWKRCPSVILAVHDNKAPDASTDMLLVLVGQPLWKAAQQAGLTSIPAMVIGDEPLPSPIRAVIRGIRRDTMDAQLGAYLQSDIQRHVASLGTDAGTLMGWTEAEWTEARRNASRPQEERNALRGRPRVIWRESRVCDPVTRGMLVNDGAALSSRTALRRAKETSLKAATPNEIDAFRVGVTSTDPDSRTLSSITPLPPHADEKVDHGTHEAAATEVLNMSSNAPLQIDETRRENAPQLQHVVVCKEPVVQGAGCDQQAPDDAVTIGANVSLSAPPSSGAFARADDAPSVSAPSSQPAEQRHCPTCSCAVTMHRRDSPGVREPESW